MISAIAIMIPRATVSANRINEVLETEPQIKDKPEEKQAKFDESLKNYIPNDNRNLIYGRYFVVRFIFNNIDNIPFRFENLSINYNVY